MIFSFLFTRPLKKLLKGTEIVSSGNFNYRLMIKSHDELGALAHAFNQMVKRLKKYMRNLSITTAEKERYESEMRFAREIQEGILPKVFPPYKGMESVEIYAHMKAAREIGGDFYDFFFVDDDHVGVVIADVSGKGAGAGLFMMRAKTLLRDSAANIVSPAEALTRMNELIVVDNPSNMFVTMFYLVCNIRTGKVRYCNAGHNAPVYISNNKAEYMKPADNGKGLVRLSVLWKELYSVMMYS